MVINTQDTRVSNTSDTRITLEQLEAGSLYTFTVQAERNGVSSDNRTLTEATDQTQAGSRQTQYCGDGGGRGLGRLWRPHLASLDLELVGLLLEGVCPQQPGISNYEAVFGEEESP